MRQARYWILTIPREDWQPILPEGVTYLVGQPELGAGGYRHWQLMVAFPHKVSLSQCKGKFCQTAHCEPTRSDAARAYVLKEETRDGEQFEFGELAVRRNSAVDWDRAKELAKSGEIDALPSDLFIRYYRTFKSIAADYVVPVGLEKRVVVYFGRTGTGKSRRAWEEAGVDAYSKDPRSKFWCGYSGQSNIVIDEFRGGIDVSHMLRWLDRYPVRVELKGASTPLKATKIWITSNLHPMNWYLDLDLETKQALLRRLEVTEFE